MRGAWLGVDVGSASNKLLNFCLIEQNDGVPAVSFERGLVRIKTPAYPPNRAGHFEQLDRWPPISTAAEWHVRAVINGSDLVKRWNTAEAQIQVAVVDAPSGFASGNDLIRATERLTARSYPTPAAPLFLTQLKTLCESENQTPLCQRYFWKLVGLVAFDELSSILGLGHPDSFAGELGELSSTSDPRRVREGFPSDSYARVNGTAGVASDEVRRTLGLLASVPWKAAGNEIGGRSSRPTAHQMAQLESKRRDLAAQTTHAGALTVMTKAAGDPTWGDLWDAFTLAGVGYAEALQGAKLLASSEETRREGTILTFDSLPPSSAKATLPRAPPRSGRVRFLSVLTVEKVGRSASPDVVAVAGPNGAGKSTVGERLLEETLGIRQFVNADDIARGLAGFAPETAAFEAGRVMLRWMGDLARRRETFAFETTLSGRGHARLISELVATGYTFHLVYLWLESPELALQRVADRVGRGGHFVADEIVRRRYQRGLRNFGELYRPLAKTWKVYDNSAAGAARPVATGSGMQTVDVLDVETWQRIEGMTRR